MNFELFTPHAKDWNLATSDIEIATQLFTQDYGFVSHQPSKLLLFLYAKGILAEQRFPNERVNTFNALLLPQTNKLKKALERLETIVEKGETSPTRTKSDASSIFDLFVATHEEWKSPDSFVVFRDHPDLREKPHALVERFQKGGLCYMHACVVVQHYLVAMNNHETVPMLNMADYLRQYMTGDRLHEHILNNKGGDSLDFLEHILHKRPSSNDILSLSSDPLKNANVGELLSLYGPGLVSGFCVTKGFTGIDWQHIGAYTVDKFEGRHAMALVGYRNVDGKRRYLLQNWWKTKPYIEVDIQYLLSSRATIQFIKERQLKMGNYPANYESLVECESGIDASENFIPDGF